jgi:hypothetical protein
MGDYLSNLVDKSLGQLPLVEPRPTPRFAPSPYFSGVAAQPDLAPVAAVMAPGQPTTLLGDDLPTPVAADPPAAALLAPAPPQVQRRAPTAQPLPPQEATGRSGGLFEQATATPIGQAETPPRPLSPTTRTTARQVRQAATPAAESGPAAEGPALPALFAAPAARSAPQPRASAQRAPSGPHPLHDESAAAAETRPDQSKRAENLSQKPAAMSPPVIEPAPLPLYEFEQMAVRQTNIDRLATIRVVQSQTAFPLAGAAHDQGQPDPTPPASALGHTLENVRLAAATDRMLSAPHERQPLSESAAPDAATIDPHAESVNSAQPPAPAIQPRWPVVPQVYAAPPTADSQRQELPTKPVQPTIRVTIGRVEVRATPPPPAPTRKAARAPAMSLDDYLRSRRGESQGENRGENR